MFIFFVTHRVCDSWLDGSGCKIIQNTNNRQSKVWISRLLVNVLVKDPTAVTIYNSWLQLGLIERQQASGEVDTRCPTLLHPAGLSSVHTNCVTN